MNQSKLIANQSQPQANKPKFSVAINTPHYQQAILNTLGSPERSQRFVASITSAVAANPTLQECTPGSVISGALLGETLNLSPSPQLGQYYLVPFNDNKNNVKKAQFIIGYKGYMQLAIRTGLIKRLNVLAIKQPEFKSYNPFTEELVCDWMPWGDERDKAATCGYAVTLEYLNGYAKTLYQTKEQITAHAQKYSKSFNSSSSFWKKDFDRMACKTMMRRLFSEGWVQMSTDFQSSIQTALESDSKILELNKDSNGENIIVPASEQPFADYDENDPEILTESTPPSAPDDYPFETENFETLDFNNV